MVNAIGHEDRQDHEPRRAEDELRHKHRAQQGMTEDELRTFPDLLQGMAALGRQARRLENSGQQEDRDDRQRRGEAEGRARADPADQKAAQRRAAGKGHGAGKLDARIGGRQRRGRYQRRHKGRRGDAVDHGTANRDEAQQAEQRQAEQAEPECSEECQQR